MKLRKISLSELKKLRRAAMNLLARREHSVSELTRKLSQKGFIEADITLIVTALVQENLLSNNRFTENYLYYRRSKGFGPLKIQAELITRGIPQELIEHHLNITDNLWLIEIKKVWQKRFKNRMPDNFNMRAQQMRFLLYRGFTTEQIESFFCHA